MTLDISHLLLADPAECGCSAAGCGAPADHESRQRPDPYTRLAADAPADVQDSAGMLYWNLFAYPVTVGSRRYAFLTDVRSVLAVDEATFVTLKTPRADPSLTVSRPTGRGGS